MKNDLRFEALYPYSPERVWRALTDPAELGQWLMPNNFEACLGHKFQFRTRPVPGFDGIVNCEVTELEVPRRLAYKWAGGQIDSVVSFTLEPVAEGTRLVLEHKGFSGVGAVMVSSLLGKGWKRMVEERLPAVLSGQGNTPAAECKFDQTAAVIERYADGARMFAELLKSVSPADRERAAGGEWSIRQTALHIVDAELVGAVRMRMLAAQPGAMLAAYHGDVWDRELHYSELPLEPAVELFMRLRETTVNMLRRLDPAAWSNRGRHEESGEVTLEAYVVAHCEHAEAHMEEIETMRQRVPLPA